MVASDEVDTMPCDDSHSPDKALVRTEMRALLERKLDALPEDFRTVFVLRAVEELSVEETADCLDIPEATVRSRHFRARGLLRESLARDIDIAERDLPDRVLVRAEIRALLERKLDQLPEDFRTVFVLRAVEELSVEETADCLGIPEATVRSRHFRARSLLRESLARDFDVAERDVFDFGGAHCDRIVAGVNARLGA